MKYGDLPLAEPVGEPALAPPPDRTSPFGNAARLAFAVLFPSTALLSAGLLFGVQPMMARALVPALGGSPSVWTTCVLFFQGVLLLGYLYAHVLASAFGARAQVAIHVSLLAASLLALPPALAPSGAAAVDAPIWWLLATLAVTIGPVFFLVSATGPLLQGWFVRGTLSDPYHVYAWSNAGSLAALVGYPVLAERFLPLTAQVRYWSGLYVVCAAGIAACGAVIAAAGVDRSHAMRAIAASDDRTKRTARIWWILLAAVPSSLMLGVTTHLSTDIAAVPLLWVLPCALYLITLIVAFSGQLSRAVRWSVAALPVGVAALAVVQSVSAAEPPWLFLPLQIAAFVAVAQACHGRLAERRPHPARLTEFYLCVAAGGVLGSAFNTLVAPQAFEWVVEYPLVLGLGVLLGVFGRGDAVVSSGPVRAGIPRRLLWAAAVLVALAPAIALAAGRTRGGVILALIGLPLALLFATRHPAVQVGVIAGVLLAPLALRDDDGARIFAGRSFFGVHRVLAEDGGRWHVLQHGTTVHGRQSFAPAERRQPFAYYHPAGPVGDVMAAFDPDRAKRVAVIGLGSGGLSAYARPGDHWTFLEIDPLVERIARTPALFTHLTDCGAACRVILGDGRVSLREMPDRAFDLILLDAFTSDAIPVHLLTREAVREYMTKLAPAGMLVFHVSNRYLNLMPTVSSAGADAGLAVGVREHRATAAQRVEGPLSSRWIAMSPDAGSLRPLFERGWVAPPEGATAWSDDYSNVLAVMQWRRPAARDEGNGR